MSRRRKTAADQLGDGLNARPPKEEAMPDIVIVDEGTEGAIVADTISGLETRVNGAGEPEIVIEDSSDHYEEGPDPYELLKRQFDERETELRRERQSREAAEQQARRASDEAIAHEKGYREAATAALDNAIELSKATAAQAQAALQNAAATGDWDTFAKAQAVLADHAARKVQFEQAKSQLESAPLQAQRFEPSDPIEQQISQFSPRAQEWLRKHRDDIFSDRERQIDAQAAHRLAIRRGLVADSDDYFNFIDDQMGYTDHMSNSPKSPPPLPRSQQKSPAVASAPPARTTFGQGNAKNPNRIALTKQQRETALQMFADKPEAEALALYAKGILEINQGKTNLLWSKEKYRGGPGV